jgi:hypothetical protein
MDREETAGRSRMVRIVIVVSLVVLPLLAVCHGQLLCLCGFGNGYYHVRTIKVGPSREIRILAEFWWEYNQGLGYEVRQDGRTVVPATHLGTTLELARSISFTTLSACNGDLVALVEPQAPEVLLVLHDFHTGNDWPTVDDEVGYRGPFEKRSQMLAKLQVEHPELELEFSTTVSYTSDRKVAR